MNETKTAENNRSETKVEDESTQHLSFDGESNELEETKLTIMSKNPLQTHTHTHTHTHTQTHKNENEKKAKQREHTQADE